MAERCGQNAIVLIGVEDTFGTQQKTPTVKCGDVFNYNDIVSPVEIPRKTGQIVTQKMESNQGNKYVDGTLEGTLTKPVLDILLNALTSDSSSPWTHSNSCTRDTLSIYRYFDLGTEGTTTDDKYNVVTCCIITQR